MPEKDSSLTNKGKAFQRGGKALDLTALMSKAGAKFDNGLVGKGIGE